MYKWQFRNCETTGLGKPCVMLIDTILILPFSARFYLRNSKYKKYRGKLHAVDTWKLGERTEKEFRSLTAAFPRASVKASQ